MSLRKKKKLPALRVYRFNGHTPRIHPTAFVHPSAILIGQVEIGPQCYVGPGAVLRGDQGRIIMCEGSNLQDGCVIHGAPGNDTIVEERGHIGHGAVLHGCHIGRNAFVGMNSVVMDKAMVGENAWVSAMAFVREGFEVPPGMLAVGVPAKVTKELTPQQIAGKTRSTESYHHLAEASITELKRVRPLIAKESPLREKPTHIYQSLLLRLRTRRANQVVSQSADNN